jgi:hypothetical protein
MSENHEEAGSARDEVAEVVQEIAVDATPEYAAMKCDGCGCTTGYYFTGSRVPLACCKVAQGAVQQLCHLCEGASIGRIYREQLVDHEQITPAATRGPDVWFTGADPAKLEKLQQAMSKVMQHHPTITTGRPCSELWAIKGLQAPVESTGIDGKVIKQWTSGVEACEELGIKVADMWGHLHRLVNCCNGSQFRFSSATSIESQATANAPNGKTLKNGGPYVFVYSLGHNNHPDFMTCGVPSPPLGAKAGPFETYMLFCCCMKSLRQTIRKKYRLQLDVRAEGLVDLRHEDIW